MSDLCTALDPMMTGWNERDLRGNRSPFVLVDALVVTVREDGHVRAFSALVATSVNEQGYREILGLRIGDRKSERTWQDVFTWLRGRGLSGMNLVVSNHHGGLVNAVWVQLIVQTIPDLTRASLLMFMRTLPHKRELVVN